jgi:signal transduction histidine kinase
VLLPRINRQIVSNFDNALGAPLLVMAEAIAEERARGLAPSALLERAKARLGHQLAIVPRASLSLPAALLERIDRGEVVGTRPGIIRYTIYARIPGTEEVLRLGPVNQKLPLGEGRGLILFLLGLCGLTVGVYLLVRPLRRRVLELSRAAESFGRGELSTRAAVRGKDVISDLATSFNHMAEEIQRLIAAQHELLGLVSHELRTPLQRLHFAVEKVRSAEDASLLSEGISGMERDLLELDELLDELLSYVRLQSNVPLKREPTDVRALVEDLRKAQLDLTDALTIEASLGPELSEKQSVDPRLLRRALSNLIGNALCFARTQVKVTARRRGELLICEVEDDGPGVPAADRQRIFEPFTRLDVPEPDDKKRPRGSHGLGLAIVRRIAERHHGSVEVDSSAFGGALFRLTLPATADALHR